MSTLTHPGIFDFLDTVFTKTAKGRAEMVARAAGLKSRQRSILIMLDGQKNVRDIALLPPHEVAEAVSHLLALELIAPTVEQPVAADLVPVAAAAHAPEVAAVPAVATPAAGDGSAKLTDLKNLMTDSANTYLGLMAADVVGRVHKARNEVELLAVVGHWHMAMRESKYGRAVAETHLAHIRSRFRGDTMGTALQ